MEILKQVQTFKYPTALLLSLPGRHALRSVSVSLDMDMYMCPCPSFNEVTPCHNNLFLRKLPFVLLDEEMYTIDFFLRY
jgi:hypothetical protein